MTITQEIAVSALKYNPETGCLHWVRRMSSRVPAGAKAGCVTKDGYVAVKLRQTTIYAHRLVWLMHHGFEPEGFIDHINRVKSDNRIENLRVVTNQVNQHNQSLVGRSSRSGILGAHWNSALNKWQSSIKLSGKLTYLGVFDTAKDAHEAYLKAKKAVHLSVPYLHEMGV
jgi:hypothetical protein